MSTDELTAEQVRKAWCGNLKRDCLYDPPTPDWQAIADELNATLGDIDYKQAAKYWQRMYEETFAERTCYDANASAREHGAHCFLWRCSNCDESYDIEMESMNYCPNCGARVMKSDQDLAQGVDE